MTGHRLSGGGIIRWFAACLALMALAFLPAGALAKGPPGHGGVPPGQAKKMRGHRGPDQEALPPGQAKKYGYRYWPEQRVFYSPERGLWFWLSAGKWRMGAKLPARIKLETDFLSLTLGGAEPGRYYDQVARAHPRRGHGPPPWAPAHGRRSFRYRYYPAQRVYYAPARGVWFWLSAGKWRMGARLPSRLTVGDDYVSLTMGVDKPYRWDAEVAVRYGR